MAFEGKEAMLRARGDLPLLQTPIGAMSPGTEDRIINEIGGIQTMCDLDFDTELNFDEDEFATENYYAREMANVRGSPSGLSIPDSPIDVTADCPTPLSANIKQEAAYEYYLYEQPIEINKKKRIEASPYMRPIEAAKPRGRPPKQVAETKRAQLAKNWRLRKQEEEQQKTEKLAMCESLLVDKDHTIDILTQENNELRKEVQKLKQTSSSLPKAYDRKMILKTEDENAKLRGENAQLSARLSNLMAEFAELKTIMHGVMWSEK